MQIHKNFTQFQILPRYKILHLKLIPSLFGITSKHPKFALETENSDTMSNKTYGKPLACITPLLLVAAAPLGGYGIYVLCGIGIIVLAALICLLAKRRSLRKGDMKNESKNGTGLQESAPRPTETVLRDRRKEPVVKAAAQLARQLHKGQLDKAGRDYFEGHLTTVANAGTNWMEMTVGYLHDAAEDTYYSVPQIIRMLKDTLSTTPADNSYVPPTYEEWLDLTEALELLNANTAPTREAYIERFRGHELALRVKLNDMQNNMDLSRLPSPGERDIIRLERYSKEYVQLRDMLEELKNK